MCPRVKGHNLMEGVMLLLATLPSTEYQQGLVARFLGLTMSAPIQDELQDLLEDLEFICPETLGVTITSRDLPGYRWYWRIQALDALGRRWWVYAHRAPPLGKGEKRVTLHPYSQAVAPAPVPGLPSPQPPAPQRSYWGNLWAAIFS